MSSMHLPLGHWVISDVICCRVNQIMALDTIDLCCPATSDQGFIYRPDRPNRRGPVPVYRSGLAGNRSVPVEFKFEFKKLSSTGSYRYTGRLDRFTGRFEFESKFKIACVTGLEWYIGRFDRFTKWALMGRLIFFPFFV